MKKRIGSLILALVILLTAVHMLRASGAVEILGHFLAPVFQVVGIPPETAMLVLIRPISGSAALAVGALYTEIMTSVVARRRTPFTDAIVTADTPSAIYSDIRNVPYKHIKRPIYPLEDI